MKLLHLLLLILAFSLLRSEAYESPDPPDYKVIFELADLVVLAQVEKVLLPRKLSRPTEVILKVRRSLKGDVKAGDLIRVFHDSGEAISGFKNGMTVTASAFRCPAFPRFLPGEDVKLYARWDVKKKSYIVPGHTWKVKQED